MSEQAVATTPLDNAAASAQPVEAAGEAAKLEQEASIATGALAARLFVQAGRLFSDRLGDTANAARCFSSAIERDSSYRPALDALRRLHAEAGHWEQVADLYAKELAFARDDAARFEILRAQATIYSRRLHQPQRATEIHAAASALAPAHPVLLEAAIASAVEQGDAATELSLRVKLARSLRDELLKARQLSRAALVAEQHGDVAQARALRAELLPLVPIDLDAQATTLPELFASGDTAALERVARAEVAASSGSAARVKLARLLSRQEASREEALEALQAAREINPRDGLALETLIDLCATGGDDGAYEANLGARRESARDVLDKATATLRLARHLDLAGRTAEALSQYARVLELVPGHPEALAQTRAQAGPKSADDELQDAQRALGLEADPAKKAALACRAALLLEELGRSDDAAARYLDALVFSPSHLGARNALIALFTRAARWPELAQLYEKEYLLAPDEHAKREALVEMAEVQETRLNDLASAQAAYRMALELRPDLAVARALVRCAQATNKPRDLAFGLEKEADCTTDAPRRRASLLHRAAEISARELKRPQEAVRLYERLLAEQEGYVPAVRGLEVVAREHPELVPKKEDDGTGKLEMAAGKALATKAWDDAAKALSTLVGKNATHPTAWAELARAHEARGDFPAAIAALEAHANLLTDGLSKADVLQRAAELSEERLFDAARAQRLVEAAVLAAPRHAASWRMLSRLALARGDVKRAVEALEQEAAASQLKDRTTANRRLAALLADHVGDLARAIALYRQIFDEDASDLWAIAELDRLYAQTGEGLKSAEFRSRFAARCSDVRAAALLRTSAAEARQAAGDIDGAVNEYRRALAVDGRIRTALDEVLLALRQKGDRAGLADLYQRMAPYLDNDSQAVLALMRGELHEADGQTALALKAYRDAGALDATLLPALREARRLHEAAGEWNEVRALVAQEGEAHPDRAQGVALVVRAGQIAEEQAHDVEQAEAHYLRALELKPGEERALARLGALLEPQGRYAELVTICEREGEATSADPVQSARLYAHSAWLRYEKLGEGRRATVPLNRALGRDPTCVRALELKAQLALAASNPAEAVEALSAALASPEADRARLQARLAEAHLLGGHGAEALVAARAAFALDTSDERLALVARAATAAGEHEFASVAFERLVQSAPAPATGARFARLGAQSKKAQKDLAGASELYRRALELAPNDAEALAELEELHLDAGDFGGLASAYEALYAASAAKPDAARGYLAKAAGIWEKAGAPMRAAEVYRHALEADPHNASLRLALARTLTKAPASRSQVTAELRALVAQAPLAPDGLRELVALFTTEGRQDAAFVALATLVGTGQATAEERAQYGHAAAKLPPGPSAALAPADLELLVHPVEAASPVRELFAAVGAVLPKVVPGSVERHGLGRGDRVKGDVRQAAERFAKLFGAGEFELYQTARTPLDAWVENTDPPSLVLGAGIAAQGVGELLFTLGLLLGRVRMRTQAAFFAKPIEVANLAAEALRQVDPSFSRFGARNPELAQLVARAVGRSEKKALEPLVQKFSGPVSFGQFTQAMAWTSHRFGLVTAGDPAAALRVLLRDEGRKDTAPSDRAELGELVAFAVSEDHLTLRARLRIALT